MTKFNRNNSIAEQIKTSSITNHAGGIAFKGSDKLTFYTRVATAFLKEPKFYKETDNGVLVAENQDGLLFNEMRRIAKSDPEFVLKMAKYARNVLGLRSVSTALLVEASLMDETKQYVRRYTPSILKRADELTESIAYLQSKNGDLGSLNDKGPHTMPASLKRGISDTFGNFDEYQLAKYDRPGKVKLKDVWRLTHPHPQDKKQYKLYKKLLTGTLDIPRTWETVISKQGSTKEAWEDIMEEMPIFATVRNLRNFLDKNCDVTPALNKLRNPEIIKKSKLFPFRFFSAYREIQGHSSPFTSDVLDALSDAVDISCDNLPHYSGTTMVVSDNSGSMTQKVSAKSTVSCQEIGNLFNTIANRLSDRSFSSVFADKFATVNISKKTPILESVQELNHINVGGSTNAWLFMEYLLQNKLKVDRIFLFSDMQCYDSQSYYGNKSVAELLAKYRSTINPDTRFYSVDLVGYGELQIPEKDPKSMTIAGWSEKILQLPEMFERDGTTIINEIDSITP